MKLSNTQETQEILLQDALGGVMLKLGGILLRIQQLAHILWVQKSLALSQ